MILDGENKRGWGLEKSGSAGQRTFLLLFNSRYMRNDPPKSFLMRKYNLEVGVFDCAKAIQDGGL